MQNINHSINLKVKKRIKDIKGFYTHLFSTFLIIPFLIFINLKTVPQFHFFWFAVGGMFIAIFLHWFGVFGFDVFGMGKSWEENKIKELINKYK